jgi:hypothetical protein
MIAFACSDIPVGEKASRGVSEALLEHLDNYCICNDGLLTLRLCAGGALDESFEWRCVLFIQQIT